MQNNQTARSGFTLIELSIVLVIIGLIVGGVLVGQDLIKAAEIRATVSQFEKYNTAVNTFRNKYNGIPGDLANATNFFTSVSNANETNQGDGDGLVEGISAANTVCTTHTCIAGEAAVFWYQLAQAGLIPEAITTTNMEDITLTPGDANSPAAKTGKGARIAVNSVSGFNYFVLANFGTAAFTDGGASTNFTSGSTPIEALQIDTKVDDGGPDRGIVMSIATATALAGTAANGNATPTAGTHCYDSDSPAVYATTTNAMANGVSCNLGIRGSF